MTFRHKLFLTAFSAAVVTVALADTLVSWSIRRDMLDRIQASLVSEARLAAELMAHQTDLTPDRVDQEADALGRILSSRVTLIAADGRVLGDSERSGAELAAMENHGTRPEVVESKRAGVGVSRRHSATLETDMMYVAVPVHGAAQNPVAIVRLALPLSGVAEQLSVVRRLALIALAVGIGVAAALAWGVSTLVSRRVRNIATVARRYAAGDLTKSVSDYGSDEVGTVARVLDQSVQDLGRRLAELAHDRALIGAILAGMTEGVIVVDTRGRLQLVNDAARRMLNIGPRAEGRPYLEAVRHPGIAGQIATALGGTTPDAIEVTLPAEADRVLMSRGAAADAPDGRIVVVVLHDVSDLKRADRVRRDFIANVSHELRTPLTAIRGYVEALADDPASVEQNRQFLGVIARHTHRMERLVRDLLRLARIEGGQERLELTTVNAGALFAEVQSALAPIIDARAQKITMDIAPDASSFRADASKLQDALRNLVENASNYSPEATTIAMRARREDKSLLLEVEDEGSGIPESDLARVFERFYRVDKSRARGEADAGGTGLGLAIVKHLVGLHGGTVTARNRDGRGAVFTIRLEIRDKK